MPNYRYQIKSNAGQVSVGVITAENTSAAAATLRSKGGHVLDLAVIEKEQASTGFAATLKRINSSRPSARNVLDFTTQLSVMVRAGIGLRAALEGIAEQTNNASFKRIIQGIKTDLESGKQFSEAISRHPKLFGPLYVNMMHAAEVSGSFGKMLDRVARNLTQQLETKKMVIGAMIYPSVIAGMAVSVTIFLLTFVLPKFAMVFEGKEDVLPWTTKFLMGLSDFMVSSWPLIAGSFFVIFAAFFFFLRTDIGSFWLDRMKLRVPLFRTMFRSLYVSRSLQTMGELINAGVPMLDTIAITGDIAGNRLYRRLWMTVYSAVKEGKKIAMPLTKSTLLPRAVVQMISAGEESGKLGEVLDEISAFYAKQLKDNIKTVTSMIEPIMIILMGSIVGFIAMAIILPIFKMSQIIN